MTSRLNARIDDALMKKLEHLRRRTKLSLTDIVKASIELYYERFEQEDESHDAARILSDAGFIACADGAEDLSSTYKEALSESLGQKSGA
jgi:predicted transcriptional regulator